MKTTKITGLPIMLNNANLDEIRSYTEKDFEIHSKQKAHKCDTSPFEFTVIKSLLDSASLDSVLSNLEYRYGHISGSTIHALISTCLIYQSESMLAKLVEHPLAECSSDHAIPLYKMAMDLLDKNETHQAEALFNYIKNHLGDRLRSKSLEIRLFLQKDDLDGAEKIFNNLTEQDYRTRLALASLRIDHLCNARLFDEADAFIDSFMGPDGPPSKLTRKIIEYHIWRNNLDKGLSLIKYWIGYYTCYHYDIDILSRLIIDETAAKYVVNLIEEIKGWYLYPDLLACRDTILSEWPSVAKSALEDALFGPAALSSSGTHALTSSEHAIFFCIDSKYRKPALVAIMGLLRAMAPQPTKPDIIVFAPQGEALFWRDLATRLSKARRHPELIVMHDNSDDIPESRLNYGYNAIRPKLSKMAFSRIFAILALQRHGYKKALYLDADIVLTGDVTPLFSMNQLGYPISAAIERTHQKISQAIKIHKISNNKYFNSGVMLVDLKHPATSVIAHQAIRSIMDPDVHLIFHDQCALNRSVSGHFHPLPKKYNFLFPPDVPINNDSKDEEKVVLHFIDAPKPWDTHYKGGRNGDAIWHAEWQRAMADLERLGIADASTDIAKPCHEKEEQRPFYQKT